MWNIDKDPWLNPSGCSLLILDGPVDVEHFRGHVARAVAEVPRLRERVVATLGRLSPPQWRPDPEFDLAYHIRHVALAPPGTMRDLLDLVSILYQDPYDRTRPLWAFHVIDGLEGGRSALMWKIHHALADGLGAGGIADYHLQRSRQAPAAAEVDVGQAGRGGAGGRPRRGRRTGGAARRRAAHRRAHLAAPSRHRPAARWRARRVGGPPDPRRRHRLRRRAHGATGAHPAAGRVDTGRLAAVATAVPPPPPRDARGLARRRQGRRQAPRRHRQRPVRHRRRQRRPRLPRPPQCPRRGVEHQLRRQHPRRPHDRRQRDDTDAAAGPRPTDRSGRALRGGQPASRRPTRRGPRTQGCWPGSPGWPTSCRPRW